MKRKAWLVVGGLTLLLFFGGLFFTQSEWAGTDVSVIGPVAEAAGVEPSAPFFNPQGDLLLFIFFAGGIAGGFAAGYLWRGLFGPGERSRQERGLVGGGQEAGR